MNPSNPFEQLVAAEAALSAAEKSVADAASAVEAAVQASGIAAFLPEGARIVFRLQARWSADAAGAVHVGGRPCGVTLLGEVEGYGVAAAVRRAGVNPHTCERLPPEVQFFTVALREPWR